MSAMELRRFRVLQDVIDKRLTQLDAADHLGLSVRQIRRLLRRIEHQGMQGVIHGLVGKAGNHRLPADLIEQVLALWNSRYRGAGLNFTHFTEKLREHEGVRISKESVRTLLRQHAVADRQPQKGRKHRKHRLRRERMGELIQQDTSPHDWLGTGFEYHAVVAVDDATSKILFLKLYEHDGTLPNMEAFRSVILRHGLPMAYYVDAAAWFTVTRHWEGTRLRPGEGSYVTQIERAMQELGIELIIAGSPQAKGRVERSNGTLQNRLIAELRLRGITTLAAANSYIEQEFIADYNQRFGVEPGAPESAFVPFIRKETLDRVLCLKLQSQVQNDNTVTKAGRYRLQLLPTATRLSWAKAPVEVLIKLDGTTEVKHLASGTWIPHEVLQLEVPIEFKHPRDRFKGADILILPKADISI